MLETLASFREPQEAHMLSARLEVEGIFSHVDYRFHVGNNWLWSNGLHGAKVRVLRDQLNEARVVERASRDGEFKALLLRECGDLDDLCCPQCGSTEFSKRRPIYQALLSAALVCFGGFIPPWRWIYFCSDCGNQFYSEYGLIGKSRFAGFDFRFSLATPDSTGAMQDLRDTIRIHSRSSDGVAQNYAAILSSGGRGWLCHLDGQLRGFSVANPTTRHVDIFVDPGFERNGIGRALHNPAIEWLFELDGSPAWALALPQSKGERFLYAAGWKLADVEDSGELRFDLDPERWAARKKKF